MRNVHRQVAGTGAQLGTGLVAIGVAGYAFLVVAGNVLPSADYAALAMLYLLVNIVGPGLFVALEQETSRAVSARIAVGIPTGPTARAAAVLALALFAVLAGCALLASPVLISRLFNGNGWLLGALLLGGAGAAGVYWARGLLGGQQQFGGYAATLFGEGVARLLPILLLPLLGLASATSLGFAFAAAALVATLLTIPWLPRGGPGPQEKLLRLIRGMTFLVAATLLSQLMANLGPVIVGLRSADVVVVAAFASAVVLARAPLFLFAPVQAVLLPGLTRAAESGDQHAVLVRIRQVVTIVGAFGLAGVAVAAALGPWAVQVFFGAEVRLPVWVLSLLATSTVLFMLAQVLQPALIALGSHHWVAIGWVAGALVFLAVALSGLPVLPAAVFAQLLGPAVVVVGMLIALLRRVQDRTPNAIEVSLP